MNQLDYPYSLTAVEYHCQHCNSTFWVYHRNDDRNQHCCWCNKEITQTGKIEKIIHTEEGNTVITYKNGTEIARWIKNK